jgi:hypothetical protein
LSRDPERARVRELEQIAVAGQGERIHGRGLRERDEIVLVRAPEDGRISETKVRDARRDAGESWQTASDSLRWTVQVRASLAEVEVLRPHPGFRPHLTPAL